MSDEVRIRRLWGSDSEYYAELRSFLLKHENATSIVYDNESKTPIRAEYYFTPWTVYVDRLRFELALLKEEIEREDFES